MTSCPGCQALAHEVRDLRVLVELLVTALPAAERDDARLVAAIWAACGREEANLTAAELLDAATKVQTPESTRLAAELSHRGALSARKIGKLLPTLEGKSFGGLILEAVGTADDGALLWRLSDYQGRFLPSKSETHFHASVDAGKVGP